MRLGLGPVRERNYERAVSAMMREQVPWEPGAAAIDLERIGLAPFPKLVMSGGWHRAFDAVGDVLEARLGARRVDFPVVGHLRRPP